MPGIVFLIALQFPSIVFVRIPVYYLQSFLNDLPFDVNRNT